MLKNFSKIFFAVVILVAGFLFAKTASATAPDTQIFSDGFETGTGNWTIPSGTFSASADVAHGGANSLLLNSAGSIYKQFPMYGTTGINSPNRNVVFYWYPNSTNVLATSSVFSLEEGVWTATDKAVEMFWDGNQAYFNLYRYADLSRTSTATSSFITISANTWHKIEIISNTTLTQIKVDDVAVQFDGSDSSSVLTNVYNLMRFSASSPTNEVKDDDGSQNSNTTYVSGSTVRYKKELVMPYDPSDSAIINPTLSFYLDKDNTLVGNFVVDINGQRALTLSNNDISSSTPNPSTTWYSFPINKALLVNGTNSIVMYSEGGTTNTVIRIDTSTTIPDRSARSADSGASWSYSSLTGGAVDGEYMVRLNYTLQHNYNIDDVSVSKENIIDTSDMFGKMFDALTGTIPSGTDKIQAIYQYFLTRDSSYLTQAETGADSIKTSYDSGNRDLFYVKEMALLATVDSSRMELLSNLADALWTYKVNQTTFLPYYGNVADNSTMVGEPPDALVVANAFMFAYKISNNQTYLEHAEAILNAVHTYMLHPTYGTVVTSANTATGAQTNTASRGDDELTNFIETSLFLYEISGNETYLNWATDQADKYTLYAWDSTNKAYYYRPDAHGYEIYIPSFSLALLHLYEYTNNQTYLDNAKDNFTTYMTKINRNGLLVHYFQPGGRYGHEPGYLNGDIGHIAALLYKYTSDSTYLDIADQYLSIVLNYYYPTSTAQLASDSFASTPNSLYYLRRQTYTTNFLTRFILPSSGVNISWAYGNDLYVGYRGIASAPMDVWFTRDAVHLLDVSGSGSIKFDPNIKKVYITPRAGSTIGVQMLNNLSIAPSTGAVDTEIAANLIDIDYRNSAIAGLAVSNADRQININNNGTTSLDITPNAGTINVNVTIWNISGTYSKEWTEAGIGVVSADHIIGNLEANTYYNLSVDGSVIGTYLSDANGQITFDYTRGYSSHTFSITEGDNTTPVRSGSSPSGSQSAGTSQVTLSITTNESSTCKYSTTAGTTYGSMTNSLASTDGMTHTATVSTSNGQSYSYYVRCQDSVGNINTDDYIISFSVASPRGGGGNPAIWTLPVVPTGGFKISIKGGVTTTSNRSVILGFNAGADIKKMAISMTGDFTDASQEDYVASKQWDLCSKLGGAIKNPTCPDGTYKVYVQFYTAYGRSSNNAVASSAIILKSGITPTENLRQTQLTSLKPFTKQLKPNQTDLDVKRLQIFLNSDPDTKIADFGAGSSGKETNFFGALTKKAVIKFQEKYAKDILTPWGLKKGTGVVGKTTLQKINELISK